ncbi:MAG: hypothetical protein EOO01_30110 [Chitinophagaceae bacterium]|nr:MAG: hypothetical protein EOO01_30110 [Chitinophagaceae bacterium]
MDSKNILTADLLDLVFDNRNKDYGAYELRKFYNKRIAKALLVTGTLVGIAFTSIALTTNHRPEELRFVEKVIPQIINPLKEEKPVEQTGSHSGWATWQVVA